VAGQRFLPTSTLAFLRVSNASTAFLGNDFALDDISLVRVPEPATWATMLVGFGSLGGLLRRRRRSIPQSAR
jgi:hypothetical protein